MHHGMGRTNDECRTSNDERMTKSEVRMLFVLRAANLLRHLNFHIRHSLQLLAALLLVATAAAEDLSVVPLEKVDHWLHFQRQELARLSVEGGRLDCSQRFTFAGDSALRWSYSPGSKLTWNCNLSKLGYSSTFFLAALAPRASGNLAMGVEFVSGAKVCCRFQVPLKRPGWNRCELQSSERYQRNSLALGMEKLDGLIADKITAVRLLAPRAGRGEIYLGHLCLGEKPLVRLDSVGESIPAEEHRPKPQPPKPGELDAVRLVEDRAEQDLLHRPLELSEQKVAAMRKQVADLHIHRTSDAMTGFNVTIDLKNDLGFESREREYCLLMSDLALAWRLTTDPARKQELLGWYQDLFDFSLYLGGMPDAWAGGDGYIESVFLMRGPLTAAGRLPPAVITYLKERQGYGRMFLRDSIYCRLWRGRTYRAGELGEDCDYTRIVTPRLLLLALMTVDPAEKVRDLKALGDWFGRIVLHDSPGVLDTFKPDGSLFHHQGLQVGYGKGTLLAGSRMIYCLSGTPFAVAAAGHAFFRNVLLRQRAWWRANCVPLTLCGKEGFKREFAANEPIAPWLLTALAGTPDRTQSIDREVAAAYLRMAGENLREPYFLHNEGVKQFAAAGVKAEPVPQGHWTLSYAAGAVHRRDDWLLALRGYSRYFYAREAGQTFRYVPFLGFGTCELLTAGDYTKRYDAFYHDIDIGRDGYDWTQFPLSLIHI